MLCSGSTLILEVFNTTMTSPAPVQISPSFNQDDLARKKQRVAIGLSAVPETDFNDDFVLDDTAPSAKSKLVANLRLIALGLMCLIALGVALISWLPIQPDSTTSRAHLFQSSAYNTALNKPSSNDDESAYNLQALEDETPKPIIYPEHVMARTLGRSNPFDPIQPIIIEDTPPTSVEDLMPSEEELIEYVGIISGNTPKDAVAIIHLLDEPDGSTKLLEIGDTFKVNDQKIQVLNITANTLQVKVKGAKKTIPLKAYVDSISTQTEDSPDPSGMDPAGMPRPAGRSRQFMNQR